MNPILSTRRLSITLAALAATALALPACGTATAASHRPHHRPVLATVQQTQGGLTFTDLQDLANAKRGLSWRSGQRPADGGLAGCTALSSPHHVTADDYPKIGAQFAGSRWLDLRTAGTAFTDLAIQLRHARGTDGYQAVWFYQRLAAACARHGQPLRPSI